ncbi:NACHT domain-containing protein [Streptomyces olivochromogenes]|uniref:NACHT domain-containing protein n=1 Tax=Streptomyces olivochromogenes TaxID=1963 RepID=UPI001F3E8107|nr:NACHT domain-containing protein [Streptomyces olivochromogenes]MCF3136973.1 NACHT domain-containing protein [Streptomyces olivochromogenes]
MPREAVCGCTHRAKPSGRRRATSRRASPTECDHGSILRAMRWWRHGIWLAAAVVMGGVLLVALLTGQLSKTPVLTGVLSLGVSVITLAVKLWHDTSAAEESIDEASSHERLEQLAGRLAAAVQEQWQAEWRLRRLQDPHPFQVQWSMAEAWLADAPDNGGAPVEQGEGPEGMSSALASVPSQRLVVLGEPGSGKSVLAVRFTLERLVDRASGDPVPVVFPLAGWQPERERLRDWMAVHLRATYPGAAWTSKLLAAGLVLPVLDGLDELPESSWGAALRQLNAELDPGQGVLLTCRTAAYTKAVETGDVLTSAAVVELRPLTFEVAGSYLARTARPVRGAGGQRATLWDPVLAHLRAHPHTPVSQALRQALSTPLMVAMARAVYSDTGKDPAELLQDRFADPAVLEHHLLEAYVPAAFADSPHAERAHRWLAYLANCLQHRTTRSLAWWQLRRELPWPLRRLGPILLLGCMAVAVSLGLPSPTTVATGGFVGGVCLGYVILSRSHSSTAATADQDRRQLGHQAKLVAMAALPVGVLVGCTTSPGLAWFSSLPQSDPAMGRLGPAALAAAFGLATVTALAVMGVVGEPRPSSAPFGRHRLLTNSVIVLLAAGITYLAMAAFLTVSSPFTISRALYCGLVAVLTGGLVFLGLRDKSRAIGAASPRPSRHAVRQRFGRPLLRGLRAGLVSGLVLGAAFAIADTAALSLRAGLSQALPQGTLHRLADGTRYVITPDGWLHGLRPNGDRYLRTPALVDGVADEYRHAFLTESADDARQYCLDYGPCTPFHSRVEFHFHVRLMRFFDPWGRQTIQDSLEVRLPNSTYATYTYADPIDVFSPLPDGEATWLTTLPPMAIFGHTLGLSLTIGITLGLVSGLAAGLHAWLVSPADTARAVSPLASLRTDRATVITRGITLLTSAILVALLLTLPTMWLPATWEHLSVTIQTWLLVSPFAVLLSAWGWFLTTRLWLCAAGRLPWRLMAFLEEAHQRGVLRQTGAAYEFRHARLQEQLATPAVQEQPPAD